MKREKGERNVQHYRVGDPGAGAVPLSAGGIGVEPDPVHGIRRGGIRRFQPAPAAGKEIGKVDAESLDNGEYLSDRLAEAAGDYSRMRKAVEKIREEPLKTECGGLLRLAENILKYLTDIRRRFPGRGGISTIIRRRRQTFWKTMWNSKKQGFPQRNRKSAEKYTGIGFHPDGGVQDAV